MRARRDGSWLLLSLVSSLAIGCGDDDVVPGIDGGGSNDGAAAADATVPDAAPPAPTLDDICHENTGVFVELFDETFACFAELEILTGALPGPAELSELCYAVFEPFVADGSVLLGDAAALAACRAFLADVDCQTVSLDAPNACSDLLVGTVPSGSDCDDEVQCAGDAYCAHAQDGNCGTCTDRKADGQPCTEGGECRGGRCTDPTPETPAVCRSFGDAGDACDVNDDCLGTMVCDRQTTRCAPEPAWAVGTPCAEFPLECDGLTGDLFCNPLTATCTAYREVGQTCGFPTGDGLCKVFAYETCQDDEGTPRCVAGTEVGAGQTCGFFVGRRCEAGTQCANHDINEDTDDICVTTGGVGASCGTPAEPCEFLLTCVDGQCQQGGYTGMCPMP